MRTTIFIILLSLSLYCDSYAEDRITKAEKDLAEVILQADKMERDIRQQILDEGEVTRPIQQQQAKLASLKEQQQSMRDMLEVMQASAKKKQAKHPSKKAGNPPATSSAAAKVEKVTAEAKVLEEEIDKLEEQQATLVKEAETELLEDLHTWWQSVGMEPAPEKAPNNASDTVAKVYLRELKLANKEMEELQRNAHNHQKGNRTKAIFLRRMYDTSRQLQEDQLQGVLMEAKGHKPDDWPTDLLQAIGALKRFKRWLW